jgi:hypothetical protein
MLFLMPIFLPNLVIQNLPIALAVLHLMPKIEIRVNLSKPPPNSFFLAHGLELGSLMQTYLFKMRGGFFVEKSLVLFVDIDLHLRPGVFEFVWSLPVHVGRIGCRRFSLLED